MRPPHLCVLLLVLSAAWPVAGGAQGTLTRVFPNVTFERPTALRHAGNGDDRLYVVEQPGRIRSFVRDLAVAEAPLQPGCGCARLALDSSLFAPGAYVARVGDLAAMFTVVR